MIGSTSTILAVGAAGKFAGLVVPALAERGGKVRGLVRDAGQGEGVRKSGATEIAIGDLRDGASLDAALKGVDAVFYVAPAFLPDEAEIGKGMVDLAKRAGVSRFVFSSVIHPILAALGNHAQKALVEEAVLTSGMEYTFLHLTVSFQNFTEAWPKIVATGVLAEPDRAGPADRPAQHRLQRGLAVHNPRRNHDTAYFLQRKGRDTATIGRTTPGCCRFDL